MAVTWTNFSGGVTAVNPLDTDNALRGCADLLYGMCGRYAITSEALLNGDISSGTVVVPSNPIVGTIYVYSSDFSSATEYNNANLLGHSINIFWQNVQRFLIPNTEWRFTATGIEILVSGFDAITYNDYVLVITIL